MRSPLAVIGLLLFASAASAGEKPLEELRAAAAAQPASAEARLALAAACEKAGAKEEAQSAYWAAYAIADEKDAARSQARDALLRLDKSWKALLDLEKELRGDWQKLAEPLKAKSGQAAADLAALWARTGPVADEEWCSTRDPLARFAKLTIEWKGNKTLGKEGVAALELPTKTRDDFAGRTVAVEAMEVEVTGRTLAERPEIELAAQVGVGEVVWGKPAEDPKAPVWLRASRLGGDHKAMEPVKLWLRYYPPKGIGLGLPLADPRMRGANGPLKLDKPLAASVRLESPLPRNKLEVTNVVLTLYLRPSP